MTSGWSDWADNKWKTASPYVDWHFTVPPPELKIGEGVRRSDSFLYSFMPFVGGFHPFFRSVTAHQSQKANPLVNPPPGQVIGEDYGSMEEPYVPLPKKAFNDGFADYYTKVGNWDPDPKDVPVVTDPDMVIVGIIDTGIAIGHNRFRDSNGKTRFLASWQQTDQWQQQPYMPFGRERYRDDINCLLDEHSVGGLKGALNEEAFNDAAGLVSMKGPHSHREIAGRYAHGTMVADLAFGETPEAADRRIGLIAVNLPDRQTVHSSGVFLDYFAIYGISRIANLADCIFEKSRALAKEQNDPRPWPEYGFPIVINLSFGRAAGAKDGSDTFIRALRNINAEREHNKLLPVQMVIPAGNHNLSRGNAEMVLANGAQDQMTFITQPEDHTPNFLEIWTDRLKNDARCPPEQVEIPLEIEVIPPGGKRTMPHESPSSGKHLQARTLGDPTKEIARIYCRVRMSKDGSTYRVGYLLCTAPTLWQQSPQREASPSGRWTIVLRNAGKQELRAHFSVQTDQSIRPNSGTGRLPYLERSDYKRHLRPTGRLRDSYRYPFKAPGNLDNSPVLRRHGTVNSMATGSEVLAVAAYRLSDGRPSVFSSTGYGDKPDTYITAKPTVAFPTDESPAHFGLLGSGGSNGSVVAMRGTSFSAALATRWVVRSILVDGVSPRDVMARVRAEALKQEKSKPRHFPGDTPPKPKIGSGRVIVRPVRKVRTMHPT